MTRQLLHSWQSLFIPSMSSYCTVTILNYFFDVFVTLCWYCVCSLAFAVTIAVSMCRGWSMELFGPEFPRVFDDAIPLLLSWQGLCWLIFLWLVSFIWPGWRLWNPWNNCIAWPWTRPSAAPVVLRLRPHFGCQETDLVSQSVIMRLMKKTQHQLPTQLVRLVGSFYRGFIGFLISDVHNFSYTSFWRSRILIINSMLCNVMIYPTWSFAVSEASQPAHRNTHRHGATFQWTWGSWRVAFSWGKRGLEKR